MAKILIVGGYTKDQDDWELVAALGKCLGREAIEQGHTLLNAAMTEFDHDIAKGAKSLLNEEQCKERIRTWIRDSSAPIHKIGTLLRSEVSDWDPACGIEVPEPIDNADVVIFVRGYDGSNRAALWADSCQTPLLPLASLGGASDKLYKREVSRLEKRYTGRITKDDFLLLNELVDESNVADLARRIIALAEDVLVPQTVAVAMSYTSTGDVGLHLKNLYSIYEEVCAEHGYECAKVTELNTTKGILPAIKQEIKKAGFALIDLTEVKPNVLFEYGYADGLGKDYLVTAKEGTELPFDVQDIGTIFWRPDDMAGFKSRLAEKFRLVASKYGYSE